MGRDRGERLGRGGEELALYRAATYGLVPRGTRNRQGSEDGRRTFGERMRANRTAGSNPAPSASSPTLSAIIQLLWTQGSIHTHLFSHLYGSAVGERLRTLSARENAWSA
jgi:hypothetical protein